MADPFIAEIRLFAGNFAPRGWAFCQGQLLPIAQNTALFALIGTFYGGNGTTTFALPDLRDRVPLHQGQGPGLSNRTLGEAGGAGQVGLTASELPRHAHPAASGQASTNRATAAVPAAGGRYALTSPEVSTQPHNNRSPYLRLNYIIALQGIFPARP